ncbi:hypothetical protein QQF64_024310 [Cirrhinus molitorella]|uniref:Uncharacterized protein n=1 Tax=Cirrhinus molitorella TaxID=172907 RepID=A0ABR3NKV2_9TELE
MSCWRSWTASQQVKRARKVVPQGRLDERYLSDHNPPALVCAPQRPTGPQQSGSADWMRLPHALQSLIKDLSRCRITTHLLFYTEVT